MAMESQHSPRSLPLPPRSIPSLNATSNKVPAIGNRIMVLAPRPAIDSAPLLNQQPTASRGYPHQRFVLQSLDWPLALQRAANQAPLARELLQLLLNFLPQVTQRVKQLLQGVEEPEILDWVHKLHGGSLYSGVPRLSALCRTLESQLRQGTAYHALIPEWLALLDEFTAIEQAAVRWLT